MRGRWHLLARAGRLAGVTAAALAVLVLGSPASGAASSSGSSALTPSASGVSSTGTAPVHPQVTIPRVPVVLFVGDAAHYLYLQQVVDVADDGTMPIVLVDGGPVLTTALSGTLGGVDTVVLYGPLPPVGGVALANLTAFVRSGGGLVMDVGDNPGLARSLAGSSLVPVRASQSLQISGAWNLQAALSPLTIGLDPTLWSPPTFAVSYPWLAVEPTRLAPGAAVVLRAGVSPIMVAEAEGLGTVVWSGINLPFHIDSFGNRHEALYWLHLLTVAGLARYGAPAGSATIVAAGAAGAGAGVPTVDRYSAAVELHGTVRDVVVTDLHGTIGQPGRWWTVTVGSATVRCLDVGTSACFAPVPAGRGDRLVVQFHNADQPTGAVIVGAVLALLAGLLLPFALTTRRGRRAVDAAARPLLRLAMAAGVGSGGTIEAFVKHALRAPDPARRIAALHLIARQPVGRWAPELLEMADHDPSDAVKDELAAIVRSHGWEPLRTEVMVRLRRWAVARGGDGAAGEVAGDDLDGGGAADGGEAADGVEVTDLTTHGAAADGLGSAGVEAGGFPVERAGAAPVGLPGGNGPERAPA